MDLEFFEKDSAQNQVSKLFCIFYFLELIFFSLSIYFKSGDIPYSFFMQFSCCLTFGNLYLLYGIFAKKSSHLALYFIIYIYNIISIFAESSNRRGLYIAFKISTVFIQIIRGITVCYCYRKVVDKFISFYFTKYNSNQELIGKCIFFLICSE